MARPRPRWELVVEVPGRGTISHPCAPGPPGTPDAEAAYCQRLARNLAAFLPDECTWSVTPATPPPPRPRAH